MTFLIRRYLGDEIVAAEEGVAAFEASNATGLEQQAAESVLGKTTSKWKPIPGLEAGTEKKGI